MIASIFRSDIDAVDVLIAVATFAACIPMNLAAWRNRKVNR